MTTGVGMFGPIGMQELLIVLLIAVLIFGAARIPEIAKSLGKALKEFKKAGKDVTEDDDESEPKKMDEGKKD